MQFLVDFDVLWHPIRLEHVRGWSRRYHKASHQENQLKTPMSDSPASTALEIRSTRSLFSTFRFDSLSCVPQPLHPRFSRNQECWNKSDLIVFSWFCEPYRDAIPSPVRRAKRSKMFFERKLVWIRLFDDLLWEGETSMRQRSRARNKTSDWQSSYRSECDLLQNEMIFTDDWLEGFGLIYSKSDRQN